MTTIPLSKKIPHGKLPARYLKELRTHLGTKTPGNGDRAQGMGRAALAEGLEVLDMALMHEHAMAVLATSFDFVGTLSDSIPRAGFFFTQALIPVEAAQRATRTTNRLLRQRNETLRLHTAALAKGNRRLEREITRRKTGEAVILKGKAQYQTLFLESQTMQRKLRQLTRQIISAQEDERKEISRELHDEVVQTLVGINVQLSALSKGASVGLSQPTEGSAVLLSRLTSPGAAMTGMPLAQRASAPCAAGQISPFSCSLAWSAASSTPGDGTMRPSSASSPTAIQSVSCSASVTPIAASSASAMGRS